MPKYIISLLYLLLPTSIAMAQVAINEKNFPDETFRNIVTELADINRDGILSKSEITSITILDIRQKGIRDLTGIKNLTKLEILQCSGNELGELDVSGMQNLERLTCQYCSLTYLNVANSGVCYLDCRHNELTTLGKLPEPVLFTLYCSNNKLQSLDLSQEYFLSELICNDNQLERLILCPSNQIMYFITFYNNCISEDYMYLLIHSLPYWSSDSGLGTNVFSVVGTDRNKERNVITSSQIEDVKRKGWFVIDSRGREYDGTSGIENIHVDSESVHSNIHDLQGRRLSTLQKGINIVDGRKVVVR